MSERASLEELKEFANKVREAGGGNPIDALMPSVPEEPSACLIAKNLNFNCTVNTESSGVWFMALDDAEVRDRIAEALSLTTANVPTYDTDEYRVYLPDRIGQVAQDFDRAGEVVNDLLYEVEHAEAWLNEQYEQGNDTDNIEGVTVSERIKAASFNHSEKELALAKEMLPYIEAAEDEAYELASLITDDGKIVV